MEYHPFRPSITNTESLTFKEVSSYQILEDEMLAGGKAASRRGGVVFYAENGKPSKVAHNQRHGNHSNDTCSCYHFK
jgi:hypothetical protein